jgi:hypothetical protein
MRIACEQRRVVMCSQILAQAASCAKSRHDNARVFKAMGDGRPLAPSRRASLPAINSLEGHSP